jgi:hypothetical protein
MKMMIGSAREANFGLMVFGVDGLTRVPKERK